MFFSISGKYLKHLQPSPYSQDQYHHHHPHHHDHDHGLSAVAGWRAGLSLLPTVALSGILGEMIYAPYDITGAKFLW